MSHVNNSRPISTAYCTYLTQLQTKIGDGLYATAYN